MTHQPFRYVMAAMYIVAGCLHFIHPALYEKIVPDYLPAHHLLVQMSGAAEILGGVGLLIPATQALAAWGIVALLLAVFPANVTMVTDHARLPSVPLWAAWLRLPLQLPLIYWAWLYTRKPSC